MTEKVIDTLIRCSSGALKRMNESAPRGAHRVRAEEFRCPDCGAFWDRTDFDGADQPHLVSCSMCYGRRVLITKMRVFFLEDKDFKS